MVPGHRSYATDSASQGVGHDDGPVRVTSSDQVSVAVHDFGGEGRPLLLSHATGFHGYCYLPIAHRLSEDFTSYALDFRGFGDTARPEDWQVEWARYGDDALAAARAVAPDGGLVGFGHSMGGAGLLMAAHRDPGLFDLIVAFEPIVFPPREVDPHDGTENNGTLLSAGARKRRAIVRLLRRCRRELFLEAADDGIRFRRRPALRGPRIPTISRRRPPEVRPRTRGPDLRRRWGPHDLVDTARDHDTGGRPGRSRGRFGPSAIAEEIAGQLPNSTYIQRDEWNHFTPFIDPPAMAALIVEATR